MARERSPKERQLEQLQRKRAFRANYDRVLIVCEGSKTEPMYLAEIRKLRRLPTANIEVLPCELGTAPDQVVRHAKELFEDGDPHKHIQKKAFEQVYAVFDRDDHESYFDALQQAESLNRKLRNDNKQCVTFKAIPSVPCFELWLLLHFEEVHALKHRDEIQRMLKKHIPKYTKGMEGLFAITQQHQKVAFERAQKLSKKTTAHNGTEPYTAIHELVQLLLDMKIP